MTKQCSKCKQVLLYSEFSPRSEGLLKLTSKCKNCMRTYARAFRKASPKNAIEAVRRWEKKNPEKKRALARADYARNKETRIAKVCEYQSKNVDRVRGWKRKYGHSEAGMLTARLKEGKRRAQKRGGIADPVPAWVVKRLFDLFEGRCAWCRIRGQEHIDHVVPLSKSGTHTIGNLIPSCAECNLRKHNGDPQKWADRCGVSLTEILGKAKMVKDN